MFDGSKTVFEKLKRPDTAIVIPVLPNNKILLAEQEQPNKPPYVALLGGRVDEGEDSLTAAKRELVEESGYVSDYWQLFDTVQPIGKIDWTIYTFVARNCKKIGEQKLDAGEKISLKELTFDEFLEMASAPDFYDLGLKMKVLEAKLDPRKMAELKKNILG